MNKYLLDTDICIFLLKGKYSLKEKINSLSPQNCSISEITLAELHYGAAKSELYDKHIRDVYKIGELFEVLPIFNCLPIFAREKVRLEQEGRRIPDFDLLIGCTSIFHDLIMVSNNEKHLGRIKGIKLEN